MKLMKFISYRLFTLTNILQTIINKLTHYLNATHGASGVLDAWP